MPKILIKYSTSFYSTYRMNQYGTELCKNDYDLYSNELDLTEDGFVYSDKLFAWDTIKAISFMNTSSNSSFALRIIFFAGKILEFEINGEISNQVEIFENILLKSCLPFSFVIGHWRTIKIYQNTNI